MPNSSRRVASQPCFVPANLVHAVVVTACVRDADLVKVGMEQESEKSVLTTRGTTIDAHPRSVIPGIFCCGCLMPENAIRKAGISYVFPCDIMKSFRPVDGSHAVHLHDSKTHIGERLHSDHLIAARLEAERPERLRHKRTMWAGIDVLDYRIFFAWIEVAGANDQAPYIGLAVA